MMDVSFILFVQVDSTEKPRLTTIMAPHPAVQAVIDLSAGAVGNYTL